MLSINLLPNEEKKLIRLEDARRILRFFAALLALGLVIGVSLLTPSYLPLVFEKRELERSLALGEEASRALEIEKTKSLIKLVVLSLRSVKDYAARPPKASLILDGFFGGLKPAISITSIVVKKSGEVAISGRAETRRALLDFEKELREGGRFQEVAVRLSDIVKGTDINFSLQGKLKSEHGL